MIERLLEKIEHSLSRAELYNQFELVKISKNIEYAQRVLLETELDGRDLTADILNDKDTICRLQELLADKQDDLDQIVLSDDEPQEGPAPASSTTQLPDAAQHQDALTTQEHILQNHRESQESISDDLLKMARTLRSNQESFGKAISADNELIDRTGEALQVNAEKMKRTGGRLSQYSRRSSWSWMYTYLAILVAFLAFFVTVAIMRVL